MSEQHEFSQDYRASGVHGLVPICEVCNRRPDDPIHAPREGEGGEEPRLADVLQDRLTACEAEVERLKGERDEAEADARGWAEAVDCKGGSACKYVTCPESEFERCWTHELTHAQAALASARQRVSELERALSAFHGRVVAAKDELEAFVPEDPPAEERWEPAQWAIETLANALEAVEPALHPSTPSEEPALVCEVCHKPAAKTFVQCLGCRTEADRKTQERIDHDKSR